VLVIFGNLIVGLCSSGIRASWAAFGNVTYLGAGKTSYILLMYATKMVASRICINIYPVLKLSQGAMGAIHVLYILDDFIFGFQEVDSYQD